MPPKKEIEKELEELEEMFGDTEQPGGEDDEEHSEKSDEM